METKKFNFDTMVLRGGMYKADDVMCATIGMILNPTLRIIRTNDINTIKMAQNVNLDGVIFCGIGGGTYDPYNKKSVLDHKFNASELLFHEYYKDLCNIETLGIGKLNDMCFMLSELEQGNISTYSIHSIIKASLPNWNSDITMDGAFINIVCAFVDLFKDSMNDSIYGGKLFKLIEWESEKLLKRHEAENLAVKEIRSRVKPKERIMVLEKYIPFEQGLRTCSDVKIVVHPAEAYGCWVTHLVPKCGIKCFDDSYFKKFNGYQGMNKRQNIAHWSTEEAAVEAAEKFVALTTLMGY